jgi:ATP-dependent Zn protease
MDTNKTTNSNTASMNTNTNSMNTNMTSMNTNVDKEPVAIILLNEEPVEHVMLKWVSWLCVMVLFVMMMLWFVRYFESPECEFPQSYMEGFGLK